MKLLALGTFLIITAQSITVLSNLLPAAIILAQNHQTGVFNFVNPKACTNNEIMSLAKKYIRPELRWENFAVEDMNKVLKAPRANVTLDASKLVSVCAELGYEIKDSIPALEEMFRSMKAQGL